ncbi:hypothetical protein [Parapedomonas caeni]|jgi:hypothetical protein
MPRSVHLPAVEADHDGIERLSACLAQGRRRYRHLNPVVRPPDAVSTVVPFPRAGRLAALRDSPSGHGAQETVMERQWLDLLERFSWAHEEALYVLRSERRDLARYHLRPRGVIETSIVYLDEFVAALARHAASNEQG